MDDDDVVQSLSAATGSPEPSGRITVTVALPEPRTTMTTTQPPARRQQQQGGRKNSNQVLKTNGGGGGGGGGGREDCWSEGATEVLIDAWGEKYVELSRGNLKQKHWKEVADIVSGRDDYSKTGKTAVQCKNRIDTVKKKYKSEKAKMAVGGGPSRWPFFPQLDEVIGPTTAAKFPTSIPSNHINNSKVPVGIPVGIRSGRSGWGPLKRHPDVFVPVKLPGAAEGNNQVNKKNHRNSKKQFRKRRQVETEEEEGADSDDSFLPEKRRRKEVNNGKGGKEERKGWEWGNCVRMLSKEIVKFGEAYEEGERAKLRQVMEMEKARMKFAKELELQRMQFFIKTQMELSHLQSGRRSGGATTNANNHRRGGGGNNNVHNINNKTKEAK